MKHDLKDIHAMCEEMEIGPDGRETGNQCMKSKGHDDPERNRDFRRRAHFDASTDAIWWNASEEANA